MRKKVVKVLLIVVVAIGAIGVLATVLHYLMPLFKKYGIIQCKDDHIFDESDEDFDLDFFEDC